jgi:hypothetical protein
MDRTLAKHYAWSGAGDVAHEWRVGRELDAGPIRSLVTGDVRSIILLSA